MGNHTSCVSPKTVRVVLHNGSVQEFERPVKAAELMLENSRQFVSHSSSLQAGRRAVPLAADDELEVGHVYLMLPMQKLNSPLTAYDVASLLAFRDDDNSVGKRCSKGRARILPVLNYMCPLPVVERKQGKQMVKGSNPRGSNEGDICTRRVMDGEEGVPTMMHRLSVCRSWKPALETITEVSFVKNS